MADARLGTGDVLRLLGIGAIAGVLVGLLGIGGGVFLVPAVVAWLDVGQHQAQGTSLLMVLFPSLLALAVYSRYGSVDMALALPLIVGAAFGAFIGARAMARTPALLLRRLFAILLLLIGLRMMLNG